MGFYALWMFSEPSSKIIDFRIFENDFWRFIRVIRSVINDEVIDISILLLFVNNIFAVHCKFLLSLRQWSFCALWIFTLLHIVHTTAPPLLTSWSHRSHISHGCSEILNFELDWKRFTQRPDYRVFPSIASSFSILLPS